MRKLGRLLTLAAVACTVPAVRAEIQCTPSAVPAAVRAEGVTETLGDIYFACSGAPDDLFTGSIGLYLSVNVTNRVTDGKLEGVSVTLNGAPAAGVAAVPNGANGVALTNLSLHIPESGSATLRISGIRGAVAGQGVDNAAPVTASIAIAGQLLLTKSVVTAGIPRRGLMYGQNATAVNCSGSPVPATLSMENLIAANTAVFTTRVTEGFAAAFEPAAAGATGTRIMVRYTKLPATVRLFVPDLVAGSSAAQPTSGGDLNVPASPGAYTPGALLLALVPDAGVNGEGGTPVAAPAAGEALNGATEVPVTSGEAYAVYEVVDGNPAMSESAHIPTYLGAPPTGFGLPTYAGRHTVTLAPLDTPDSDAIPRFVEAEPPLDCTAVGDCLVFPQLSVNTPKPFDFTAIAGGPKQSEFGGVDNAGGGYLSWTAALVYKNGSGWASVYTEPNVSYRSGWFRVDVDPSQLAPGVYEATLVIDGGPAAGTQSVPIRLTVQPGTAPVLNATVHAASFKAGALAPGSIASIFGERLSGTQVKVLFDEFEAQLFYLGDTQINLLIPAGLKQRPSAQVVVVVDDVASPPKTVALTAMNPAIFANGVLNQDWTVNSGSQPAAANSVLQIFATGLPDPADGKVVAKFGSQEIGTLDYAGPAPGFAGLWQVNLRVPAGTPAGLVDLALCGASLTSTDRVCSPVVKVAVQ